MNWMETLRNFDNVNVKKGNLHKLGEIFKNFDDPGDAVGDMQKL